MNIVVVGHVDHGKSTVVGRLLTDTGSLPQGKLESVRQFCEKNSRPFEYAFLLDALKDEQSQGITIDAARVFFKTKLRDYIIIDAPGHMEFLKNMVTGAARADAALLVIDAHEGIQENSRRHGYLLSLLGVRQVAVLINKMDLVGYDERVFKKLADEYGSFLKRINVTPLQYIPAAGFLGENIVKHSGHMPWYRGGSVADVLDRFHTAPSLEEAPLRVPVQDVYKFTKGGDTRRIVAGSVVSGRVKAGDEVVFWPSGKKSKIKSLVVFNALRPAALSAGMTASLTLTDQIYVTRGELLARAGEKKPHVTTKLKANVFWLGSEPFAKGRDYFLKIGTAKVPMRLAAAEQVLDSSSLEIAAQKDELARFEVGQCVLELNRLVAFDLADEINPTGRFVIVDNHELSGGGIIREAVEDDQAWVREKVYQRNVKWEHGSVLQEKREERFGQKATLVLITGPAEVDKKEVARGLEQKLFAAGRLVYMVGMRNLLYGLDADLPDKVAQRNEHFRRLSELCHILLDAGMITVVTSSDVNQEDLKILLTGVPSERVVVAWMGDKITTGLRADLKIPAGNAEAAVTRIHEFLAARKSI